jgi:hypothetical protein
MLSGLVPFIVVTPETPYGSSRGVLLSFQLSLSYDRASWETNRILSRRALAQKMSMLWKHRFRIRTFVVLFSRLAPISRRSREIPGERVRAVVCILSGRSCFYAKERCTLKPANMIWLSNVLQACSFCCTEKRKLSLLPACGRSGFHPHE